MFEVTINNCDKKTKYKIYDEGEIVFSRAMSLIGTDVYERSIWRVVETKVSGKMLVVIYSNIVPVIISEECEMEYIQRCASDLDFAMVFNKNFFKEFIPVVPLSSEDYECLKALHDDCMEDDAQLLDDLKVAREEAYSKRLVHKKQSNCFGFSSK